MRQALPYLALTIAVVVASGCREPTLVPPRSLDSPTSIAVARGGVCLTTFESAERVIQYVVERCEGGERGAIGLIANEQSDRLALMDLSIGTPRLVDLEPSVPGPNHIEVGRLPVDVAASPDGFAAYTLNQLDRDVSIVDLLNLSVHPQRYSVDEIPIALQVEPVSGEVVVAAGSPSRLYSFEPAGVCGDSDDCPAPNDIVPRFVELPGTVSDFVFHPQGDEAWIVYRDLDYATTVSFGATPEGFDTACLNGVDVKPCVTANIPLTFGCADGLDNDGDGLVDQQDSRCFGPSGAESALGLSRAPRGACSNGIDDDEDGLVDREDPECIDPAGAEDELAPYDEVPLTPCNDGVDNDGDGLVDFPEDPDCYGPLGRTERRVEANGFDSVGVDTHGVFFYITDRVGEQVLVVDGRLKQLIDAPVSQIPSSAPVDAELGIDVTPSPLDIQGVIDRRITWQDPNDSSHVVVRYDYGAWTSSNAGVLQYVDTAVTFCEFTGEVVATEDFWRGRESDAESDCLELPAFPLADATSRVVAADPTLPEACLTEQFIECATCLEGDEESCEACDAFASTQFDLCQRAYGSETATLYVNPRFGLRDVGGDDGRLLSKGTCEQPEELIETMQGYADANPGGPQDLTCDSPLMPQPISPAILDPDSDADIDDLLRADLLELRTLQFDTEASLEPLVGIRPADQRILTEALMVTYEGVIPGTSRNDGVFDAEPLDDGTIWFDVGFSPCARGVQPGDRLLVTSAADGCDIGDQPEYEIMEVTASEVRIAPIAGFNDDVPTRECYATAASYEVRVSGEWTVVGDSSGFLSPLRAAHGQCVQRFAADELGSRVRTDALFDGPYYSLYLYPGLDPMEVQPIRGTAFTFQSSSGFESATFPTCSSLGQQCAAGLFPAQIVWVPGLPNGTLLLSPDPNDNFVHIRNLDDQAAAYTVVR